MKIDRFETTKQFNRSFIKLRQAEQARVKASLVKASINVLDPTLHLHELKGSKAGTVSLNAGGDLRILCRIFNDGGTVALLLVVGTHNQLYG